MSNYPDNMSWALYDQTIGSSEDESARDDAIAAEVDRIFNGVDTWDIMADYGIDDDEKSLARLNADIVMLHIFANDVKTSCLYDACNPPTLQSAKYADAFERCVEGRIE